MDPMTRRTAFRKSSYSSAGNCVEVGSPTSRLFAVRDTKHIDGPWVSFSVVGWREFVGQIKADVVVTPGLLQANVVKLRKRRLIDMADALAFLGQPNDLAVAVTAPKTGRRAASRAPTYVPSPATT